MYLINVSNQNEIGNCESVQCEKSTIYETCATLHRFHILYISYFLLSVKAVTLMFISGCGLAILSA